MRNILIFATFFVIAVLAAFDTKSIIDEIAAMTPSQVEIKRDAPKTSGEGIHDRFNLNNPDKKETSSQFNPQTNNSATRKNPLTEKTPKLNPIQKLD